MLVCFLPVFGWFVWCLYKQEKHSTSTSTLRSNDHEMRAYSAQLYAANLPYDERDALRSNAALESVYRNA